MKTCEICGTVAEYIINQSVYMCTDCMESARDSEYCECIDELDSENDDEDNDDDADDAQ